MSIDTTLVRRLIAAQFPQWAELPVTFVRSAGTDNAIFRLGDKLAVRLPRRAGVDEALAKELMWMPKLAPLLPIAVPHPLAVGAATTDYPWPWYIYRWLDGENAVISPVVDQYHAATVMAQFLHALWQIDPSDGPEPGSHNFNRGEPLANRDAFTRAGIASLPDTVNAAAVTEAWESALETPLWSGAPRWIHGDLQPGNVLVRNGQINAIIDFGGLGVGDPACDLMAAWTLLSAEVRHIFRAMLPSVDDAMWARGRGWALSVWVGGIAYYAETHPLFARMSYNVVSEVLADHARFR